MRSASSRTNTKCVIAPSTKEHGSLTKNLQVIRLKTKRLVHVLQKSTRGRDENIHSRQALAFVFEILPTDHEPRRKTMIAAYGTQYVEYLDSLALCHNLYSGPVSATHQFTRRGYDQSPKSILGSPFSTIEYLECRNQEGKGFPTSSPGGA